MNKKKSNRKFQYGKRGEGWVILQILIFISIAVSANYLTFFVPLWLRIIGLSLLVTGGVLGSTGILYLGKNLSPFPRPKEDTRLVLHGVYKVVRHPIYSGLIFGTFGWSLIIGSLIGLVLSVILFLFFDLKSRREENWLIERFPAYNDYRKRVKKLIPLIY
jgi:protein-S-isoprenylcysteine O-methyltransferase Ste14